MTENEALKLMESLQISKDCELIKTLDFKATVIKALEDLQQYREIGAIKEFKALKEKEELFDRNIKFFNKINLEIRNKSIDEFAEKAIRVVYEANNRERNPKPRDMVADIHYKMMEIAEQMKGGE